MPSPIQQAFIEGLLHGGLFPRLWAWSGEQSRQIPCQRGVYALLGRQTKSIKTYRMKNQKLINVTMKSEAG